VEERVEALVEDPLGKPPLQAGQAGGAAVVLNDVIRAVWEGREVFEGIVVLRRWLSCLQAWDAALLEQVKGNLPVKDKG
jgi:hypothetical protein